MDAVIITVISLSALLQYLAAYFAFRNVKTSGYVHAWTLISLAFFIMGVRRTTILWRAILYPDRFNPDPISEWFGLAIAGLLLIGVLGIVQLFRKNQQNINRLRETEVFLARAQHVARLGSYHLDFKAGNWDCSAMLMEIFGIDATYKKDIRGWLQIVHPDQRAELEDYLREEVVGKCRPFNYDYRIVRPNDGQVRWVQGSGVVDLDAEGTPVSMVGTILDITDRMVGVMELRESERRFHSIVDNLNDGYIIHDFNGTILDCNDNECHLLGYRKDELVGRNLSLIDSGREKELFGERTRVLKETGKVEFDGCHIRKDGIEVWVAISARMISNDGKGIVQSFVRDITERKNGELALKESEQRFKALAESLPQAVFETDHLGNLIYANRSAHEMFGYESGVLEHGLNAADTVVPEDRPKALQYLRHILEGNVQPKGHEYTGLRKDGTTFPIVIYSNFKKKGDKVTGSIGMIVDLTEAKSAEEERRRLQEQFFQAQKMESIGTLAGGIAHDFNNLLSGILGSLSIMELDAGTNTELHEEIAEMKSLVKRGAGLTRQLLGFARRGKYDAKPLDLTDVIEKTVDLYKRTRKDIVIRTEYPSSSVKVLGDRSQMEQVLMNLFVNAGQAMPEGGVLSIRVAQENPTPEEITQYALSSGPFAQVKITDTGVGMDPATMERIFEPFFTTKGAGKGTGLGLASVYGIVKNHGGFVKAESRLGEGTTFTVYLPATELSPIVEAVAQANALNVAGYAKKTILLVDDEEPILRTCTKTLEKIGFTVLVARNGREALHLFKEHKENIAVVILDMVMPGLTGMETFEEMKQIDPKVKVLLASGYSRESRAGMVLEGGSQGFIEKPFDLEALSAKLRELI